MLRIAAIADKTIRTYHILLLMLTAPMYHTGSVTNSFKDLVTLHKTTLQQIFW